MKIKKTFKWWWGWNPSTIENYLEKMAKQGYKLINISGAITKFQFSKDKPTNIRYAMDFNYKNKLDEEYMTIADDAGWEYVTKCAGWIMWRKKYDSVRPSFFTDNQSLIDRNKRLIRFLSIMTAFQIPLITLIILSLIDNAYTGHILTSNIVLYLYIPTVTLFIYCLVKLLISNRYYKNNAR